jgi:subtilisin-like proprotein convertase family protein
MYFGGAQKVLDDYGTSEGTKLVEQYNIFGDATLLFRTRTPRVLDVDHPASIQASGSLTVSVAHDDGTPAGGATVALTQGNLIDAGVTGANGTATLAFAGLTGSEVLLTVTAFNTETYQATLSIGGGSTNQAPVADAGTNQAVTAGQVVGLDGSGSTDPDGDALEYTWTQTGGPAVALSDVHAVQPEFDAPWVSSNTTLTFSLVVSDGQLESQPDTVNVVVQDVPNQAPVADAGSDQIVVALSAVTLSGLDSFDPDGDPVTFSWTQTAGPSVSLSSPTAVQPTFTAPDVTAQTTLTFSLVVSDGSLESAPDSVNVMVRPPSGGDIHVASSDTPIDIPDNNSTGILSSIQVAGQGNIGQMEVQVDITHTWIGDLKVVLECPDGSTQILHNRTGSSADDIHETYAITACLGQAAQGVYRLRVSDHARRDIGTLDLWQIHIQTGEPPGWDVDQPASDTPISIPDNNSSGIQSTIQVGAAGSISALEVDVDITHTWIGDLKVVLECPDGSEAILHNRSGGSADDIHETYAVTACNGGPASGGFKLRVSDHAGYDLGTLDSWRLRLSLD